MSKKSQETEAKFYVSHLDRVAARLNELDARLVQPRILETNLRFDLPDGSLTSSGRVLRLRQDTQARLTYKGAGQTNSGVLDRQEIEFIVEDGQKAHQFLEALGYRKSIYYEKYRTTYELDETQIMLDELPYGRFLEIEGETVEQIQAVAAKFHLNWGAAIPSSYTALFDDLRRKMQLRFEDISFDNFLDIQVAAADLNVRPADE
jgi:adenylate cyclase, class 2